MDPYVVNLPGGPPPPPVAAAPAPGVETKRLLLTLGALCLVVSLGAGTALIWSALGRDGQIAVMLATTVALLGGAVAMRRLPATAEALAVVGTSALVIDAIAARTLGLSFATQVPLHGYIAAAAALVGAAATVVALAAPALVSPLVGTALAPTVLVTAWLDPMSPTRAAILGPIVLLVAAGTERVLRLFGPRAVPGRSANAVWTAGLLVLSTSAVASEAVDHRPALWAGVALALLLLAVPELAGRDTRVTDAVAVLSAGSAAFVGAVVVIATAFDVSRPLRLAAVVAIPALVMLAAPWPLPPVLRRVRIAVSGCAGLVAFAAFGSLGTSEPSMLAATASLTLLALATSVCWPTSEPDGRTVRAAASIAASVFGSVAMGLALDLQGATVPEAYVATPALWWTALGVFAMWRTPTVPSIVLLPGLVVGTLPSLTIALQPDTTRQVLLLVAAAWLVGVGAQARWGAPMAVGAGLIGILLLRIVGPEVAQLPRWLSLGVIGAVLLSLGATWEARLADLQRMSAALRPRIAALR